MPTGKSQRASDQMLHVEEELQPEEILGLAMQLLREEVPASDAQRTRLHQLDAQYRRYLEMLQIARFIAGSMLHQESRETFDDLQALQRQPSAPQQQVLAQANHAALLNVLTRTLTTPVRPQILANYLLGRSDPDDEEYLNSSSLSDLSADDLPF